jgi:hypothetical protein
MFLGMIQMLSYIPLLHCKIPENFKYFGVSKVSIPFESLPDWVPNPISFGNNFIIDPNNPEATAFGYISSCFLYNFRDQLFTWFTVILMYLAFCILTKIPKEAMYELTKD